MRLKDILDIYHKELDATYGAQEVDSFFNLLIVHFLNIKRLHLVLDPEYVVDKSQEQSLFESLSALKLEQPIQYILGNTEFYGLPFNVTEATLIPRPETEELVSWIISDIPSQTDETIRILDIGTGSGCIAISLAQQIEKSVVSAMDISKEALKVAESNAKLNTVDVHFIHADILNVSSSFSNEASLPLDIIVSNPPYVRQQEKAAMKANVLHYEPHTALFVDDQDPLQFYRAICEFSNINLKPGGVLYFEINEYLGREMVALLKEFGFQHIELKQDIFGKDRMIKGIKSPLDKLV